VAQKHPRGLSSGVRGYAGKKIALPVHEHEGRGDLNRRKECPLRDQEARRERRESNRAEVKGKTLTREGREKTDLNLGESGLQRDVINLIYQMGHGRDPPKTSRRVHPAI